MVILHILKPINSTSPEYTFYKDIINDLITVYDKYKVTSNETMHISKEYYKHMKYIIKYMYNILKDSEPIIKRCYETYKDHMKLIKTNPKITPNITYMDDCIGFTYNYFSLQNKCDSKYHKKMLMYYFVKYIDRKLIHKLNHGYSLPREFYECIHPFQAIATGYDLTNG